MNFRNEINIIIDKVDKQRGFIRFSGFITQINFNKQCLKFTNATQNTQRALDLPESEDPKKKC